MKNFIVLLALLVITFSMARGEVVLDKAYVTSSQDQKTGLSYEHSTASDLWEVSGHYAINADLLSAMELNAFEGAVARRWGRYFVEFFAAQTTTKLSEVTNINTSSLSDLAIDFDNSTYSILEVGLGLKLRSTLIQNLINSPKYFDTAGAYLTYLSSSIESASFSGLGMKASYGIHKRMSNSFQLGIKADYHLGLTSRPKEDLAASQSDSLVLSWLSLAFTGSFYF